jgi:DNA (cytosine-5)-methyltransferase 1
MKHLDLFSGIGGFALAARWAGIETVAFCEIDTFCHKVLNKNFPGIPIHNDIKTLNGEDYAGIDLITGGYPCQPFSVAGSQKAQDDDRHLWPEMRRIIAQAKPTWIICENVYGHIALGLDSVLHDLESIGYACQPFVIPALAAGANHNRDRVFVVAYAASNGCDESKVAGGDGSPDEYGKKREGEDCHDERRGSLRAGMDWESGTPWGWGVEPEPIRVDDGLPDRMDRCKSLGNAIVPQIAYEILRCIRAV